MPRTSRQQLVGDEAAAERAGDEVLRRARRAAPSTGARGSIARSAAASRAAAASTSSSACVGTHGDARHCAGLVAAASGALQQARDAFRAADLQHLVDRREVDAEVEARRADDGTQPARRAGRPRPSRARRARASRDAARSCRPSRGRASRIAWYQISVGERTLVNTSVERARSIARITCGSSLRPMWPAQGKRSIVGGRARVDRRSSSPRGRARCAPARARAEPRQRAAPRRDWRASPTVPTRAATGAARAAARAPARPARRASSPSARAIRRRRRRRDARSARASRRATAAASGSRAW